LSRESEALFDKVRDTVPLHVPRRFRTDDVADPFGRDRTTFGRLVEDGRRFAFGSLP
jgi:hypothetical protein